MTNLRVELTNWAHALATYIGALIAAAGGGATVATFFGAHIQSLTSIQGNGVAGLVLALASKFIDSANNALATKPTSALPAQPVKALASDNLSDVAPAPTPAPPVPAPAPTGGLG